MTEGTGLSRTPEPLLEGGESLALKGGKSVYVPRWAATKVMRIAKFLASIELSETDIQSALTSPMAMFRALMQVAEEKAIAFVDMCLTAEDRARLIVGELDYIDFISLVEAIVRVNLMESDRKKLLGLVASLRASAAGLSSIQSSQPSAV
jgi:hypothetical protein